MVQQIMEKFNEYRLVNNGTGMATGDTQRTTEKESTLRNLLSKMRNTVPLAAENSPLIKDGGLVPESMKNSGTKRQQTSPACSQSASTSGTNGHLVYVRRKLDTESAKTSSPHSTLAKKPSDSSGSDPKSQPGSSQEVLNSLPLLTSVPSAPNKSTVPTAISVQPETQKVAIDVPARSESQTEVRRNPTGVPEPQRKRFQLWEERFLRLQMYLKSCDESSHEEYMRQLKSLSAAGRSKHAYELERRAIHLTLEEAKELRRMMLLNVLGKALPDGHPTAYARIHTVE